MSKHNEHTQNRNLLHRYLLPIIIAVVVLILLFTAFYMMGDDNSWFSIKQIIGIVVAAAMSGVITVLLLVEQSRTQKEMSVQQEAANAQRLKEQRESETKRNKDVKIYSNKIAAFSSFNKAVWTDDLDDPDRYSANVDNIRKQLYSKAILYLDAKEVRSIAEILPKEKTNSFPIVLSGIIGILNRNAEKNISADTDENETQGDDYKDACRHLWEGFAEWSACYAKQEDGESSIETSSEGSSSRSLKSQAWHFCEWDTRQLDSLDKGLDELSLIEYGEYWRTNLVKSVKNGDIVFLFRGSKKYSGVFKAKGWRVFEYDPDRMVEEKVSDDNISRVLPSGKHPINDPKIKEVLEKYDIFESYLSAESTSCANIVCERICYFRDGVDNPNTTYRKTISRYYEGYAVRLLEEFKKKESDPVTLAKINDLYQLT